MSVQQLDSIYNSAKEFDIENASIQELEKQSTEVRKFLEESALNNFNSVYKFFCEKASERSSDPHQDISENYGQFISLLKEYKVKGKEVDYINMGNNIVLLNLYKGCDECHSWLDKDYYGHFNEVYSFMNTWKSILEGRGFKFNN